MKKTPALVMGLNPNGLGLVKSLVRGRIPVYAIDHQPSSWRDTHVWMSSRTRLCKKILLPAGADENDLVDAMVELGESLDERIPVLPSGDIYLYTLARHRERLEPYFRFYIPDPDILDLLMKKGRFHGFCEDHEIPAPRTVIDVTPELLDGIGDDLKYPILLKPEYRSEAWSRDFPTEKALEAADRAELEAHLAGAMKTGEKLMIQEIIPGPDSNLFFSHAYYGADSQPLAIWTGRKLRQYPPRYGTSTLIETVDVPYVAEVTNEIAKILGLKGYVSVEFKFDTRDDTFQILEVTPARSWYPHFLGATVGKNLPMLWYEDLMEQNPAPLAAGLPKPGVVWIDEYRDLVAAHGEWRAGRLTLREWAGSYTRVRSFSLTSLLDPIPGVFIVSRLVISVLNRLKHRKNETPS